MARKTTGQLYENRTQKGVTFGVRFRVDGERTYESLGRSWEGFTRADAEKAAEVIMAQVRLGQFRTRRQRRAEQEERKAARAAIPTFEEFALDWLERRLATGGRRGTGLSRSAESDFGWRLAHLNGFFGDWPIDQINEDAVERYAAMKRAAKLGEGGLGATSTNKTLSTMEAIMKKAYRYRWIDREPVAGFRVPGVRYHAEVLETAAQATALLDAAAAIDVRGRFRRGHGRPLVMVLLLGGLRIEEALSLRWRDIDLAKGTLKVRKGKTAKSRRTVELLPPLREALAELKACRDPDSRDSIVFATSTGRRDSRSNVRRSVLTRAVEAANLVLEEREEELIPTGLTLHGLRHTFCSVMLALRVDAGYVADQAGHTDAGFTLSRYRQKIAQRELPDYRLVFEGDTGGALNAQDQARLLVAA
jgi:integrase